MSRLRPALLLPLLCACQAGPGADSPCGHQGGEPLLPGIIARGGPVPVAVEFGVPAFSPAARPQRLSLELKSPGEAMWLVWDGTDSAFISDVRRASDRRLEATLRVPDWAPAGRWFLWIEQSYGAGCQSLLATPALEVR